MQSVNKQCLQEVILKLESMKKETDAEIELYAEAVAVLTQSVAESVDDIVLCALIDSIETQTEEVRTLYHRSEVLKNVLLMLKQQLGKQTSPLTPSQH